jgi:hypothetical protein
LLNSLSVSDAAPGASGAAPAITPEHAKVISTKLDALLGDAAATAPSQVRVRPRPAICSARRPHSVHSR